MKDIRYYRLIGKYLHIVSPSMAMRGSRMERRELFAEDYAAINAYPRNDASLVPPKVDKGFKATADGYELIDGKWNRKWKVDPIIYTYYDYNRALEDYIRSVRVERGYDEREPSSYMHSKNPRWKSDAEDWVVFIDDIMTYALPFLNMYLNNEEVPSLEEFKAGFPKLVWSYTGDV